MDAFSWVLVLSVFMNGKLTDEFVMERFKSEAACTRSSRDAEDAADEYLKKHPKLKLKYKVSCARLTSV